MAIALFTTTATTAPTATTPPTIIIAFSQRREVGHAREPIGTMCGLRHQGCHHLACIATRQEVACQIMELACTGGGTHDALGQGFCGRTHFFMARALGRRSLAISFGPRATLVAGRALCALLAFVAIVSCGAIMALWSGGFVALSTPFCTRSNFRHDALEITLRFGDH